MCFWSCMEHWTGAMPAFLQENWQPQNWKRMQIDCYILFGDKRWCHWLKTCPGCKITWIPPSRWCRCEFTSSRPPVFSGLIVVQFFGNCWSKSDAYNTNKIRVDGFKYRQYGGSTSTDGSQKQNCRSQSCQAWETPRQNGMIDTASLWICGLNCIHFRNLIWSLLGHK